MHSLGQQVKERASFLLLSFHPDRKGMDWDVIMSLSDPEVFRSYCLLIMLKDSAARKTFIFSFPSSKRRKGTTKIEQVDRVAQRKGSSF